MQQPPARATTRNASEEAPLSPSPPTQDALPLQYQHLLFAACAATRGLLRVPLRGELALRFSWERVVFLIGETRVFLATFLAMPFTPCFFTASLARSERL